MSGDYVVEGANPPPITTFFRKELYDIIGYSFKKDRCLMEKFEKFLDWWDTKERWIMSILFPFLTFIIPCLYVEEIIKCCNETIYEHFVRLRVFLFWSFVIAYPVCLFFRCRNEKRKMDIGECIDKLNDQESKIELLRYNSRELFDGLLLKIYSKINNADNNTRISLYSYSNDDGFVMVGRYCKNPAYCTPGRGSYPSDEGVIALGWENGWAFRDFKEISKNKLIRLFRGELKMRAPEKLKMLPIQIAALRITTSNGPMRRRNLGVIVVETLKTGLCSEAQVKEVLEDHSEYLATVINVLQDFIPSPKSASSIEE